MAFYKRGFFKRPYRAVVGRYSRKGKPRLLNIAADVIRLKQLVNAEKNFIDAVSTGTLFASATTGDTVLINGIPEGDDVQNRTGRSLKMVDVDIIGFITLHASATNDNINLAIVLDKQPNGALSAYNNIYDLTTAPAGNAHRNLNNYSARFQVLKTMKCTLDSVNKKIVHFHLRKKISVHTRYANTGGTITGLATNALLFCFGGNNTTNTSTINYSSRIRYIDN